MKSRLIVYSCLMVISVIRFSYSLAPKKVYSIASTLNVRSEPSIKGKVLGSIPYGKEVNILKKTAIPYTSEGIKGFWVKVSLKGNLSGYIFSGYLITVSPPPLKCESLEGYADKVFRKVGKPVKKVIGKTEEGDEVLIRQKYSHNIILDVYQGFEWHQKVMIIKGITVREGFLIGRRCWDKQFYNMPFTPEPKGNKVVIDGRDALQFSVTRNNNGEVHISHMALP